jgi:hypothetical protein
MAGATVQTGLVPYGAPRHASPRPGQSLAVRSQVPSGGRAVVGARFSSSPDGSPPGSPPHRPRRTTSAYPGVWRGCFSHMGARACALAPVPLGPVCRAARVPTASQQFHGGPGAAVGSSPCPTGKWNPLAQRVRVAGAAAGGTRRRLKARWRPRRGARPTRGSAWSLPQREPPPRDPVLHRAVARPSEASSGDSVSKVRSLP